MGTKTPRPVPQFFEQDSPSFSTKSARGTPKFGSCYRPPAYTAPPVMSRVYPARYNTFTQPKPKFISFASSSNTRRKSVYSPRYDCKKQETYLEQTFEILGRLGSGSFGEVFKARNLDDKKLYAVKQAMQKFRTSYDRTVKLREVEKHELLPKHPNLVNFVRAWEERGRLYIQTELCQTSLSEYLDNHHTVPEDKVLKFLTDLLLALKHLHEHDLVHMDVKPDNVFISYDEVCKLGDFGLVVDLQQHEVYEVREGDAKYLAPELLRGIVGPECDIFSLGLTMLEAATDLDVPQSGEPWQLLRQGKIPEGLTKGLSKGLFSVLRQMMSPVPRDRPSAAQLLTATPVKARVKSRQRYATYLSMKYLIQDIIWKIVLYLQLVVHSLFWWIPILNRSAPPDSQTATLISPSPSRVGAPVKLTFDRSSDDEGEEPVIPPYHLRQRPLNYSPKLNGM